jgi:hypothetical protein
MYQLISADQFVKIGKGKIKNGKTKDKRKRGLKIR